MFYRMKIHFLRDAICKRHTRRRWWWWWWWSIENNPESIKKKVLNTHSIDTHRMNDTIYIYLKYQWWWDRETWNAQYISMSLFALFIFISFRFSSEAKVAASAVQINCISIMHMSALGRIQSLWIHLDILGATTHLILMQIWSHYFRYI